MNRRLFAGLIAAGAAGAAWISIGNRQPTPPRGTPKPPPDRIKPPRLKTGDKVGLITPGSYIPEKELRDAIGRVSTLGFQPVLGKHIRTLYGYLAGSDAERLDDLHAMFRDPSIRAVWCARGGYGCTRLLPHIDYELIRANPKPLIGYSDITALFIALYQEIGLVSFHGPLAGSRLVDYSIDCFKAVLMEGRKTLTIRAADAGFPDRFPYQTQRITRGQARGRLIGGNLSLLTALSGTAWSPQLGGHIVFLEEVEEKPYSVDRMLTQLRQANQLGTAAGIAMGIFNKCIPEPEDNSLDIDETLTDRLQDLRIPTYYGLPYGHIRQQATVPTGIEAELDVDTGDLRLLEAAVV